jgi:hypothetical protein
MENDDQDARTPYKVVLNEEGQYYIVDRRSPAESSAGDLGSQGPLWGLARAYLLPLASATGR